MIFLLMNLLKKVLMMKTDKKPVYIIDGLRTPFMKARGKRGPFAAADLAVYAAQQLFLKLPLLPSAIDEVIAGCTTPSEDEANIARIIGLRLGCGIDVPAFTVSRNCGSGMQAVDSALQSIMTGRSECVLALGTEVMSRTPLLYNADYVNWLSKLTSAKTVFDKIKVFSHFRPGFLKPIIALSHGLTDPTNAMIMGKTAEEIAFHFGIARKEMDLYAISSHQKAQKAWDEGRYEEVVPLVSPYGDVVERDDGIRPDISLIKLAQLKPAFEQYGTITAGNSSQITDGAGCLLLASEAFVKRHQLSPIAVLHGVTWTGCEPSMMGLGPVRAMSQLLEEHHLTFQQMDTIEINEAFAAQILAIMKSFEDPVFGAHFCQIGDHLGTIDLEKLNPCGGAIALGHPIAASGIRIILRTIYNLKQQHGQFGLASLCIGGGQGGATLVEAL
jgi:acetyl-CoA C-acetyltransferase